QPVIRHHSCVSNVLKGDHGDEGDHGDTTDPSSHRKKQTDKFENEAPRAPAAHGSPLSPSSPSSPLIPGRVSRPAPAEAPQRVPIHLRAVLSTAAGHSSSFVRLQRPSREIMAMR